MLNSISSVDAYSTDADMPLMMLKELLETYKKILSAFPTSLVLHSYYNIRCLGMILLRLCRGVCSI
jgi:hypothetical protein